MELVQHLAVLLRIAVFQLAGAIQCSSQKPTIASSTSIQQTNAIRTRPSFRPPIQGGLPTSNHSKAAKLESVRDSPGIPGGQTVKASLGCARV